VANAEIPRRTLLDSLVKQTAKNLYCEAADLSNEASVEHFFIVEMLKDLNYRKSQIKTKKSISELTVSLGGAKSVRYRPDYVLTYRQKPRWVMDAKAADEQIEDWIPQCSGYCLRLNQQFPDSNPVQYFVLTNGLRTNVYQWDLEHPLLELEFSDFEHGNPKYEKFCSLLSPKAFAAHPTDAPPDAISFRFERPSSQTAKQLFSQCHTIIWKSEGESPTSAFTSFVKLMFVKLYCDRQLRQDEKTKALLDKGTSVKLPRSAVTFSLHWIEQEKHAANPVNDLLFKSLRERIEADIQEKKKKRIFDRDEQIGLRPDTIKAVVARLQHWDMFGIDEDLNGRLFETFLSATMRGRGLGQFFTPRSVVKLMTAMANLRVSRDPEKTERVIDACCGTGGFLIEALTDMRNAARRHGSLNKQEKDAAIDHLSNKCLYGIDFGKSPPIARIARINMYLHGDGGSRIYYADALDKEVRPMEGQDLEIVQNLKELQQDLNKGLRFDAVLTNPPFSMTKELANDTEARILKQYDLAKIPGTSRLRSSLRSNVMFLERYRDLLRPGGRLLTVIDDTLLASDDFDYVRDFIRTNFIIRAIISLPGDTFRRSGARVKTSILYLEKKHDLADSQSRVFVAFAEHLGVDDLTYRASTEEVEVARQKATDEIMSIDSAFKRYLDGDPAVDSVGPERVADRLDLKTVVPLQGRFVSKWRSAGIAVKRLHEVLTPLVDPVTPQQFPDQEFLLVMVTYDGICTIANRHKGKHIKPESMQRVHAGDLVFSNIRATDGAIGVVPPELDGALASGSFTILRASTLEDTVYLWSILRTYEIRADLMSPATGTGRYTTTWSDVRDIQIPWLSDPQRKEIAAGLTKAWAMEAEAKKIQTDAIHALTALDVNSEQSERRLKSYKPPQ
jgi:type I restriction enzyme M protein